MSLLLRSFLRDPRPYSRAVRRLEDDWLDDWPVRKLRRTVLPAYEHPISIMEDVGRQMASTLNRMQDFVNDMDSLDEFADRLENRKRRNNEAVVKRTESGGLQLALDVADFKPDDLKIKLVDDHLVIEAENESAGEDSYRKSHFKRWFKLPDDCKVDEIKSKLTEDNRLLIDLPLEKPIQSNVRTIPIEVSKKQAVTGSENAPTSHQQDEQQQHDENSDQVRRSARRQ